MGLYGSGHLLRAICLASPTPLPTLTPPNPHPIRFASTKEPSVISVDVLGHVNKLNFSKMLWGAYVADTECLLDGKAGQIPSLSGGLHTGCRTGVRGRVRAGLASRMSKVSRTRSASSTATRGRSPPYQVDHIQAAGLG